MKPKSQRKKSKYTREEQILDPEFQWGDDQSFQVQKLLDETIKDGNKYYLVKWKGFDMAMNTWELQSEIKHLPELIRDLHDRKKKLKAEQITIRQNESQLVNPYRATQSHGHFLYGDIPKSVVKTIVKFDNEKCKKKVYLQIQWNIRRTPDGEIELQNSIIDSNIVFEHAPQFLLNFYQNAIRLNPPPV